MSKELTSEEALCYLDDIAHGRKMKYDAHELKLIIEKELKVLKIVKKYHITPAFFTFNPTYNAYEINVSFYEDTEIMSEEEYNLAKEVLL